MNPSIQQIPITKVNSNQIKQDFLDHLAIEEPLEISILLPGALPKNISITMRTPGRDQELALGFLLTEGILTHIKEVEECTFGENTILVKLNQQSAFDMSKLDRHFYTSSSCGVCGKASIDSIKTVCRLDLSASDWTVEEGILFNLPHLLRKEQEIFQHTGGIHAAALFTREGQFISMQEDVGRHNALDKLIGQKLMDRELPLNNHLLLLSGRASFELIQKAAMAGIQFVMAVGAPSSLAVELAKEFKMTLIGFLNQERFNIYSGKERIQLSNQD